MKQTLTILLVLVAVWGKGQSTGITKDTFSLGSPNISLIRWGDTYQRGDTICSRDMDGNITEVLPDSLAVIKFLWNRIRKNDELWIEQLRYQEKETAYYKKKFKEALKIAEDLIKQWQGFNSDMQKHLKKP